MDTFELLPSLAQGELAETSAPELVSAVFRSRASGTLWMETEESAEIRCFFRAGDMCGTGIFKDFQTLAHVLLAHDWVAALDIESTREEAASSGRRHGEVLVERGFLTHDQLRTALGAQHTANLARLLSLNRGRYDWRGWEPPPAWAVEVVVDPVACVVDALELEQHAPRRRRVLEWMGDQAARLSLDWPELLGRVNLGPVDRRAAALLALPRTLEEFVEASRLPQTRAEALMVALLLAGGVEPQPRMSAPPPSRTRFEPAGIDPQPEPVLEPLPEAEIQPEVAAPQEAEPGVEPLDADRLQPAQGRRAVVNEDEALARLDSLSLDDLAAAPAAAPAVPAEDEPLEIDHARRGASAGGHTAKITRDEPTLDLELEGDPGEQRSRDAEVKKKLVARGLRNLGSAPRAQQDGAIVEELPEQGQIDESQLSPQEQQLVDEVRSRLRLAPGQNAYARLGVSPAAPAEHVKSAYLTLAKRFHPDRAAGALAGLAPQLQSLFSMLKDAHDSLSSPAARARYDEKLKAGGSGQPASRKEDAGLALKMGDVLLKKRDFEAAITKLRRAVDLEPNGDSLAALAWALVLDPKATPSAKEEAAGLINRALRAPGATARTFYVAGVLWRTKDPDSAVEAFRKALELDASHSDAALELRLIEQRRGKQGKSGGGVLSGLLFGKRKG